MDVRRLLERPSEPLAFGAHQRHGLPGRTLLVRAPWGVVEAHFVHRYWSPRGAVLLRGALSAHDLARAAHPGLSGLAVWLGALDHGPSAPSTETADLASWLPDADAAAQALDEALQSAFGPAATARADLLIRLAQGVLLREDAPEGRLRPFLPSGPRVQLLDLRRPNRHVAIFRKRAGRGLNPPDLQAIAGRARAVLSYHGEAAHAHPLDSIAVRAPEGVSAHAALAFRADLLADFAALGHDLERWLL